LLPDGRDPATGLLGEAERAKLDQLRAKGLSWHKIALPLGMTVEGVRRRFAPA